MNEEREKMLDDALNEIIDYAQDKPGVSYYDIKGYAYKNNLENWIAVMKNKEYRTCLALFLRSKRRVDDVPYTHSMHDSVKQVYSAKQEYNKKKMTEEKKTVYVEPGDFIPEDIRKEFGRGEYNSDSDEKDTKPLSDSDQN